MASFQRGDTGFVVPYAMFAENRTRLCAKLKDVGAQQGSFVLLQGGVGACRYPSTDVEPVFRQESYFHWAFGAEEEGCYGAIEVHTGKSLLFIPRPDDDFGIWIGKIQPIAHYREKYDLMTVHYADEMSEMFSNGLKPSKFLLLNGINPDNRQEVPPATFKGIEKFAQDKEMLWEAINECRVIKSKKEIELLRYVSKISMDAHKQIMKKIEPGMYEFQIESLFKYYTGYFGGARFLAYNCICATLFNWHISFHGGARMGSSVGVCASGDNGAVLHFTTCKRKFKDGDMCLFDMGAEYCCYASDITFSYPVSGKFTPDQLIIYNAVLDSSLQVMANLKPGG